MKQSAERKVCLLGLAADNFSLSSACQAGRDSKASSALEGHRFLPISPEATMLGIVRSYRESCVSSQAGHVD